MIQNSISKIIIYVARLQMKSHNILPKDRFTSCKIWVCHDPLNTAVSTWNTRMLNLLHLDRHIIYNLNFIKNIFYKCYTDIPKILTFSLHALPTYDSKYQYYVKFPRIYFGVWRSRQNRGRSLTTIINLGFSGFCFKFSLYLLFNFIALSLRFDSR